MRIELICPAFQPDIQRRDLARRRGTPRPAGVVSGRSLGAAQSERS